MDNLIVACCANKLDHAAPARELYQNRAWKFVREELAGQFNIMALSAEHGLISSNEWIEPYDRILDRDRQLEIRRDHRNVLRMKAANLWTGSKIFYVYGGELYRELVLSWCHELNFECRELIGRNRGCGDHYNALKALRETS